jgi:hypothetical protein
MKNTIRVMLSVLLLLSWVGAQSKQVAHAHATAVYAGGKATFTIFNDSTRDINAWIVSTVVTYKSGLVVRNAHIEDYGPQPPVAANLPGSQPLRPKSSTQWVDPVDHEPGVASVHAKVAMILFDDKTAEASDDVLFSDFVANRKSVIYTMNLLSSTLRNAAMDEQPTMKAKSDLAALLVLASKNKRINKGLVQGAIDNLKNIPAGHERETVQLHASGLDQLTQTFGKNYADIRRLP